MREYGDFIEDILVSVEKILKYTEGLSCEQFEANSLVIDAVVRNLEIIGEAAKNVPCEIKDKYPDIPWRDITGMRDKIAHEYFGVNLKVVWKTVLEDIPALKTQIKTVFDEL